MLIGVSRKERARSVSFASVAGSAYRIAHARLNLSNEKMSQSKKQSKPLSEAHIQATCTAWLVLDGWRCVRTDMPHLRGLGVSEPGMADNLYIRYSEDFLLATLESTERMYRSEVEMAWIEWKRKGGKAGQHQQAWHARERARGALTLIASEDFPASIQGFAIWYAASGLQRKSISIPK